MMLMLMLVLMPMLMISFGFDDKGPCVLYWFRGLHFMLRKVPLPGWLVQFFEGLISSD